MIKRLLHSFGVLILIAVSTAPAFAHVPALRPAPAIAVVAAKIDPGFVASHKELIAWINLAILVAFLIYFLRKPTSQFFDQRSVAIREGLEEGRKALAAAKAEMEAVEEKLLRLDQEMEFLKTSALEEIKAERERMRSLSGREAARILESAGHSIDLAMIAAKAELKTFAALQASELAEKLIRERMDEHAQAQLVNRFREAVGRAHEARPPA
ncbi:MAG: hypothetical protein ACRD2B_11745 [Terriglobia bacterium]